MALAGCGVPDSGAPVVDRAAPGVLGAGQKPPSPLPSPMDKASSDDTVDLYFHAASSEWEKIPERVQLFLAEEVDAPTSSTILVVRDLRYEGPEVDPERPDEERVNVSGWAVGKLTQNGTLLPASGRFSHTFHMYLQKRPDWPNPDQLTWLVRNPPQHYVLSEDALNERYDKVSLYFSNHRATASLIPDLRYVPRVQAIRKSRNLLVDWLLAGPSSWLSAVAVSGFSNGTKRQVNVVVDGDRVVVNLTSEVGEVTKTQLAQLVWTLLNAPWEEPERRRLEVRVAGQPASYDGRMAHSLQDFEGLNAVPQDTDSAMAYYVSGGKVTPLAQSHTPEALAGSNDEDYNEDVVSAALSRAGDLAALVREKDGRWSLWLGRRTGLSRTTRYQEVSGLPPGPIGPPEWAAGIGGAPGSFLVAVAGVLYQVEPGKRAEPVKGRVRDVSAVSVAPDGFRIALISGGRLYVGSLVQGDDSARVAEPRRVADRPGKVADVAWRNEHLLVVVARGLPDTPLWDVNVNGLHATPLTLPGRSLGQVAAYPTLGGGQRLVTENGRIYEVYSETLANPSESNTTLMGGSPFFAF
jgi:hypothetical protein